MTDWLRQMGRALFFSLTLCLGLISVEVNADLSVIEENVHNGVASCAGSVCHGKLDIQEDRTVWLNEYRTWQAYDRHSKAYNTLRSKESKLIAQKLGLKSAATADICLDCHADNVPKEKRGKKFKISDGVGCEACHGGSEKWIKSHTERSATHGESVERGLFPVDRIDERSDLCLSCHLGTNNKFTTHAIMGAGHPRLVFELETFTANQPAHYEVDEDYVARKGEQMGYNAWVLGQLASAERYVALLSGPLFQPKGELFPELALYDCHSCHHPMDQKQWTRTRAGNVGPGTMRLQRHYFVGIEATLLGFGLESEATALRKSVERLLRAGQTSAKQLASASNDLANLLADYRKQWKVQPFNEKNVFAIRRALLSLAAKERASDFNSAEQVFLSVEALSYVLGDIDKQQDALDKLFKEVEDDRTFRPASFSAAAKSVVSQFK